jgi:DNA-binding response OmpR family regulator
VLLVEDDPVTGSALQAILKRRGYSVQWVSTVGEGMAGLGSKPQFVVLDMMLPDGDGSVILQHIRRAGLPMSVLVTTAVSEPHRLREIRDMQPDLLLQKPIDVGRLILAMQVKH